MGTRFDLTFTPDDSLSLVRQLMHTLIQEVQRGRLQAGDKLPGTRALALQVGVSRKTVETAYEELIAEGWLVSLPRSGTFVSQHLPHSPIADGLEESDSLHQAGEVAERVYSGTEQIDDGKPDIRLSPLKELMRAYKRSLLSRHHRVQPLAYGAQQTRDIVGKFLNKARGLAIETQNVMLTRGSQMALYLVAHTAFSPGDRVAIEEPGYTPAREALLRAGCQLVPVKVDEDGMDIEELTKLAKNNRIKGVLLTPHHQFPTTVTIPPMKRLAIQQLSLRYGLFVIEDDYDFEYHFGIAPQMPLASIGHWERYAYVGSFSKLLGPFVRLGFLVASPALLRKSSQLRLLVDGGGDPHLEAAVCELMEDGELARHARRMRIVYQERRDTAAKLIEESMPEWHFSLPTGGLALWLTNSVGKSVREGAPSWVFEAVKQSESYFLDGPPPTTCLRLGYGSMDEKEIQSCVSMLSRSF